jgi:Zn-dependent protease/predicted transcriptional regulator
VGSIAGIPLRVHYTWLFAVVLITWSLAAGFFPATHPGWATGAYWMAGVVAALGLFASVLLHELSHSLVATARGLGVASITLFIFGGVSSIEDEAEEPKDEFLVSIVGPLTSFGIAAVAWGALQVGRPGDSVPGAILSYLVFINILLGGFNLLPGFPLDGGRVLRSIVWAVTGSLRRATNVASYVGQVFAFGLIVWGVLQIFGGNLLGGMWIAFIGWFLNTSAESSRQQVHTQEMLRGVRVVDLMNRRPPWASPDLDTRAFVLDSVMRQGVRALPVLEDGRLVGIVSVTDAKEVPSDQWDVTPVGQIMTAAPLKTVSPRTEVTDAVRLLVEGDVHQAPVIEGERLVGMISRSDVLRYMQLRGELGTAAVRARSDDRVPSELPRAA